MADRSIELYAARALADRLGPMRQQIDAVRRADDIEAVHQMRVASRRLRAALQIFTDALPKAKARRWRKQIRKVTRALGAARDADVQIEFVDRVLERATDRRRAPGLKRLRLRLAQQRDALQADVDRAMDQLEASGLFESMPRDLHAISVEAQLAGAGTRADALLRQARCVIQRRLEELLAYQQYVDQPHMAEQLHQMRIAAKRLRYTMEVFADVYEGRLDKPLKRAKRLQGQLGQLHDMDVWIDTLPRFIEQERRRHVEFHGRLTGFARIKPGIDDLLEHCIGERLKAYEQFRGTWDKLSKNRFWPKLRHTLKAQPTASGTKAHPVAPPASTKPGSSSDGNGHEPASAGPRPSTAMPTSHN